MVDIPEDANPMRQAQQKARPELPKRFYKSVSVGEAPGGHTILLDGRPTKTPAKRPFVVPSVALAEFIAEEWRAQSAVIDPKHMPATRLINSAIDGVSDRLSEVVDEIVRYAGSDLLCYRAEEPEGLVSKQNAAWDPVIAWAEDRFGVRFVLAGGLMPVEQIPAVKEKIGAELADLTPLQAAALNTMTVLTGSALLALAVYAGHLSIDAAWSAAHVDEDWNIEKWGEDDEASARRADRLIEMRVAGRMLSLVSS